MTGAAPDRLTALVQALLPERRTRIADVGANPINASPYQLLLDAGHADVWGFEPAPEAFAELQGRQSEHEHYLPYAVGAGGTARLNICHGGGFSSLLTPNAPTLSFLGRWHRMMRVVETIEIQTRTLDDIKELPRIDLLKIDIQGGELDVFRGGRDRLSDAVAVISEAAFLPLYEGQPLLDAQMRELGAQGFHVHKFLHLSARPLLGAESSGLVRRMHRNQLIDGDVVFIRDMRDPAALSDEQLKHMAILADMVFASFDLALRSVEMLVGRGAVAAEDAARYAAQVPGNRIAAGLTEEGAMA